MNAARDNNDSSTLIGISSADHRTPVRVQADPVTGWILATIVVDTYSPTPQKLKIDDNHVRTLCGVTNDANRSVRSILTDPANPGYVLANVTQI